MKRCYALLLTAALVLSLFLMVGCGGSAGADVADDAAVQGITDGGASPSEEEIAMLQEVFGLSEEEIAAMPTEQLQAMLYELGYVMGGNDAENNTAQNGGSSNQKKLTLSDVNAGGKYVVTVGDTMLWNYFELHYENGVLQSMTIHFQKNDEEEPEIEVLTGDAARGCEYYEIDFSASPSALVSALQEKLYYTAVYIERAQ